MPILYSFYGDDFTGSTDVLEQLGSNGIPAVLFIGTPSAAHLAEFPDVQAIGIAGDSRSRSPEWMAAHLPAIFSRLRELGAPLMHYKVCSTFDSSPTHGSIGRAMETGMEVFSPTFIPIVVGAPHLRRYVAFGNLFAANADGFVQRIDRHPMSHHPVTPMREADLRVHLAAQTDMQIGLIDLPMLQSGGGNDAVCSLVAAGKGAILFDTVDAEAQATVGALLWSYVQARPMFSVGSSGLTAALISAWSAGGLLQERPATQTLPKAKPLLVVSGSCSEKTERQIRYALANGYRDVALKPARLIDRGATFFNAALRNAEEALKAGQDTVLYTTLGPAETTAYGAELGAALGKLLREILGRTRACAAPVRRVVICGGDTSSHAVQQLGIHALTWAANLQPGGPLCRARADSELDGLELVLKGGQVGTDDFFDVARG